MEEKKGGVGKGNVRRYETENEDAARAISRVRLLTRRYSRVGIPFPRLSPRRMMNDGATMV